MKLPLFRDVLDFARNRVAISDYRGYALRAKGAGAGYDDRMRALDFLLQQGCIQLADGKLSLNKAADWEWIGPLLRAGSEGAWEIADTYVPSRVVCKVEEGFLAEIGLAGELAVLSELERLLPKDDFRRVSHVSLTDDSAGYDILSPRISGKPPLAMLEVKTSTRVSSLFRFFISRNEINKGLMNQDWSLVCVELHGDEAKILGHLGMEYFSSDLPKDVSDTVRVSQLEIELSKADLIPGLP